MQSPVRRVVSYTHMDSPVVQPIEKPSVKDNKKLRLLLLIVIIVAALGAAAFLIYKWRAHVSFLRANDPFYGLNAEERQVIVQENIESDIKDSGGVPEEKVPMIHRNMDSDIQAAGPAPAETKSEAQLNMESDIAAAQRAFEESQ